ncbi:hypothetical protein XAP6164_820004 [Xanthomonas phaseoli pv. phaseoli]|uniref:Uncharacterized protein n=1 Tax=Xanthomonas campestris pv. phaseoli TaxID=317013 RepID=A0ABY1TPV7_XANCH|nr:hypothetical protein XAP6984_280014 [Xanthomonas phaseoli pv. phaseoli]SOO32164.1 hypothetical protein XAP6164_820004 [Xanthomonas phaseoli pv. phaseoli]
MGGSRRHASRYFSLSAVRSQLKRETRRSLERVLYVEVSAKRPVARRDKAGAAAQAGRLGKARNAVSARHRTLPGGLHGAGAARLALTPAKPAPRSTRSAPLTANASHLNVHSTL